MIQFPNQDFLLTAQAGANEPLADCTYRSLCFRPEKSKLTPAGFEPALHSILCYIGILSPFHENEKGLMT